MKKFAIGFTTFLVVTAAFVSVPFVAKQILGPHSKIAGPLFLLLLLGPVAGLYASVIATQGGELWQKWLASSLRPQGAKSYACLAGGLPIAAVCLVAAVGMSKAMGVAATIMFLPFAGGVVLTLCGLGGIAAEVTGQSTPA